MANEKFKLLMQKNTAHEILPKINENSSAVSIRVVKDATNL